MSFIASLPLLGRLIEKVTARFSPDREKIIEGQQRINEEEIRGAPSSRLRLWRSFLGWALALAFVWEIIVRSLILTYWPNAVLPPSMLSEVSHLLLGMLGLGL